MADIDLIMKNKSNKSNKFTEIYCDTSIDNLADELHTLLCKQNSTNIIISIKNRDLWNMAINESLDLYTKNNGLDIKNANDLFMRDAITWIFDHIDEITTFQRYSTLSSTLKGLLVDKYMDGLFAFNTGCDWKTFPCSDINVWNEYVKIWHDFVEKIVIEHILKNKNNENECDNLFLMEACTKSIPNGFETYLKLRLNRV